MRVMRPWFEPGVWSAVGCRWKGGGWDVRQEVWSVGARVGVVQSENCD
jgi:hypothetical protein